MNRCVSCFKMAAPAMFVTSKAVCAGNPVLFGKECLHRFVSRKRPFLLEVYRCLCSPGIDTEAINYDMQEEERPIELGESDPANHTEANLGQYYTVPGDVTETVLSSLLTKKFRFLECKMAGNTNIMIRQPALDVITHLKGLPQHAVPPKFIFYGLDGCGKSLSLAHVVHHCYLAGWFILLVPSVFKWVHGASELQISTYHTERFDQPAKAVAWLQLCRSVNGQLFSQLKTSQKYIWGKRDNTVEGEPLSKVVDQGLQRINFATDAVGVILKEIKQHPSLKVLYAVDEFNGFFQKTSFMDPKQKFIKPNRLGLVHHFTKLLDPVEGLKRGAMAFALSRTGLQRSHIKSCLTADLLGPKGLSEVKDFIDIHVPPYSPEELECCLQFFKKRGILAKGLNRGLIKEIAFVSNYEPRRVSAVVMPH